MKQISIGGRIITKEDIKRLILNIAFIIILLLIVFHSPKVEVTHIDHTETGELITMRIDGKRIDYYYEY